MALSVPGAKELTCDGLGASHQADCEPCDEAAVFTVLAGIGAVGTAQHEYACHEAHCNVLVKCLWSCALCASFLCYSSSLLM